MKGPMTESPTEESPAYSPEQLKVALSLCGTECLAGNVRLVATYIATTYRYIVTLEQSQRDYAKHATALDSNWSKCHDYAMEALRGALEMPDASIPEMLAKITSLSERAREGVVHDGRICPCGTCSHLRENPTRLRVWHDDESTYAIAYSRLDLLVVLAEYDIESTDGWYELAPKALIKIKVDRRDGAIAPADAELDDNISLVELSAAEWITHSGRGFLCTSEY